MKNRGRLCAILSMIGIFSCLVLPGTNAETFDIGEIVESDAINTPFTSGVYLNGDPTNATKIFDGDLSSGIIYEDSSEFSNHFWLQFTYPIFVNNITVKSSFGGGRSNYSLEIELYEYDIYWGAEINDDIFLSLNCSLDNIHLSISESGTNNFYFNDIIINYTPTASNLEELQFQINDLKQQINQLDKRINELNNSMLQLESENAELWLEINNLTKEIEILESTEKETIIEKDPDNNLVYTAMGSGILGIIVALVAIILASRKLGSKEPTKTKGEPEDKITPEEKE
ncbi:MAG: hypothetical protein JSW00_18465 [Thermoplasmata archaeon]|nr:MAG: hypothetical protein JSW00_18465 [Thermoplasmata archaeon]